MLARVNRLTRGDDYRTVVRRGAKFAAPHTITYVRPGADIASVRFGFIVSKQVGGAVVRNTVRRRLKAVCAPYVHSIPAGSDIVIRALPASAAAPFDALEAEIARSLARSGAR